MFYLIKEETTVFALDTDSTAENKWFYECSSKEYVKDFCKLKTKEIEGTYDVNRMSKTYIYNELSKLN